MVELDVRFLSEDALVDSSRPSPPDSPPVSAANLSHSAALTSAFGYLMVKRLVALFQHATSVDRHCDARDVAPFI